MTKRLGSGERSAIVLAAINDKGQMSKEIAAAAGMDSEAVRKPIARLCAEGLVFKAKFSSMLVWYFKTEAAAKAFTCPVRLRSNESGFTPPKVQSGFERGAEVVQPAHVKKQKCPGYLGDPRFEVKGKVSGGFADMGIGRYVEETV